MEHYEIAGYRSAIAVANALGESKCAAILKESLAEEEAMAKFLETNAAKALKKLFAQAEAEAALGDGRRYVERLMVKVGGRVAPGTVHFDQRTLDLRFDVIDMPVNDDACRPRRLRRRARRMAARHARAGRGCRNRPADVLALRPGGRHRGAAIPRNVQAVVAHVGIGGAVVVGTRHVRRHAGRSGGTGHARSCRRPFRSPRARACLRADSARPRSGVRDSSGSRVPAE